MPWCALAVAAALLLACSAEEPAELHESIAIRPGATVHVRLDLGSGMDRDQSTLVLSSHEASEVRVDAVAEGGFGGATRFAAGHRGDDVLIEGKVAGGLSWLFGGPILRVEVRAPPGQAIDVDSNGGRIGMVALTGPARIRAAGPVELRDGTGDLNLEVTRGDVTAAGHEGRLRVHTTRGDVEIARVAGSVEAKSERGDIEIELVADGVDASTARGDIEIEGAGGPVRARTSRGSIEVHEAKGRVEARTARGSIEVHFSGNPAGTLETDRGSIAVEVPAGAGADLEARTGRGHIRLDEDLKLEGTLDRDVARGSLGSGGERLALTTARGNIVLAPR